MDLVWPLVDSLSLHTMDQGCKSLSFLYPNLITYLVVIHNQILFPGTAYYVSIKNQGFRNACGIKIKSLLHSLKKSAHNISRSLEVIFT